MDDYTADVPGNMGGMAYPSFMASIDTRAAAICEDASEVKDASSR